MLRTADFEPHKVGATRSLAADRRRNRVDAGTRTGSCHFGLWLIHGSSLLSSPRRGIAFVMTNQAFGTTRLGFKPGEERNGDTIMNAATSQLIQRFSSTFPYSLV